MKKLIALLLTGLFSLGAAAMSIDDEQEHVGWMKSTQATVGSLRKNLSEKQTEAAGKDAAKLSEIFKNVEAFYLKRKWDDAVGWAKQAQTAASDIAKAGDNAEAAAPGMKNLMGACNACHTAHREKLPEGGYKIK